MTITAWRIVKRKHAKTAFTGEGARLFGGRWNSPGVAVVYTAQSQSLAALEIVAHLDSPALLANYVVFEVTFEESMSARLDPSHLPKNWRTAQPSAEIRAKGDAWVVSQSSLVLRVPSAIVPAEHHYLLNPKHPAFSRIRIGKPRPFHFDLRLARL